MSKCFKCNAELDDLTMLTKVGPLFIQLCDNCKKLYAWQIKRDNGMYDYRVTKAREIYGNDN
jgi:hypothetical protein